LFSSAPRAHEETLLALGNFQFRVANILEIFFYGGDVAVAALDGWTRLLPGSRLAGRARRRLPVLLCNTHALTFGRPGSVPSPRARRPLPSVCASLLAGEGYVAVAG
jgi:hypothetical protein